MRKVHGIKMLLAIVVVVSLLGTVMSGCGGSSQPKTEEKKQAATEQAPAAAAAEKKAAEPEFKNVEINYWNVFTGADGKGMQVIVDAFNKENEGKIKVNAQIIAAADMYNKLVTAVASGTAPNIGIMHLDRILEFQKKGILLEADPMVNTLGLKESEFPSMLWNASVIDGKRYGIPLDTHLFGLYYNVDMLKEAGITELPKTKDEFVAACQKMTKDTNGDGKIDQWGTSINPNWPSTGIFWGWAAQLGAKLCLENGETPDWDGPAGVEAAQFMYDLIYKYKVSPENLPPDGNISLFKQKKVAFEMNGIWQITDYRSQKDLNFATAPFPQIGSSNASWAGSHHFVFYKQKNADATKLAAAVKFAGYVSDHSLDWAKAGQVPARNSVRNSEEFKALKDVYGFAQGLDSAYFFPKTIYKADIFDNPNPPVMQSILTNKAKPEAALKDAVDKAKKAVAAKK